MDIHEDLAKVDNIKNLTIPIVWLSKSSHSSLPSPTHQMSNSNQQQMCSEQWALRLFNYYEVFLLGLEELWMLFWDYQNSDRITNPLFQKSRVGRQIFLLYNSYSLSTNEGLSLLRSLLDWSAGQMAFCHFWPLFIGWRMLNRGLKPHCTGDHIAIVILSCHPTRTLCLPTQDSGLSRLKCKE